MSDWLQQELVVLTLALACDVQATQAVIIHHCHLCHGTHKGEDQHS